MPKPTLQQQSLVDAAAWNVFARHQPYYHVLSDPRMLDPGAEEQEEFWASGERDVRMLMEFGGLTARGGVGVDFGCGLGRLTRALAEFTDTQIGLDISTEMVARARGLHAHRSTVDFRPIDGVDWPVTTASASLVISLLVFNHLSTAELMEHALGEIGRVLGRGGHAVFNMQTMTIGGELMAWLHRLLPSSRQDTPRQAAIRSKLEAVQAGEAPEFAEEEILGDMFQMEFRRLKSISLRRVEVVLRDSRLHILRMSRDKRNGSTLIAAEKIS